MSKEDLGKFIRDKRDSMGLSRRVFAEKLGISEPYLKNIESGQSRPATERLFDWAPLLRVSPEILFEVLGESVPGGKPLPRSIPIPYDFPPDAQHQVETFAKFLQYQEEFEQFLKMYQSYEGEQPDWDTFMKEVRASTGDREKNVS